MHYVELVTIIALLQFFGFGVLVGRARGTYHVNAPAITGHEMFERAYRVQMNTLELIVLLLPATYLAATLWSPLYTAISVTVYIVGRTIYWRAYLIEPKSRTLGFVLSITPILVMLVASLISLARFML